MVWDFARALGATVRRGSRVASSIWSFLLLGPRWAWLQAHEWLWFGVLLLGGFTVASMNEFAVAILFFLLSGVGALAQLSEWEAEGFSATGRRSCKVIGLTLILIGFTALCGIVNVYRDGRPWSQLPKAIQEAREWYRHDPVSVSPSGDAPSYARSISREDQEALASCLSKTPGDVSISVSARDQEASALASNWLNVFRLAHWNVDNNGITPVEKLGPTRGTWILIHAIPVSGVNEADPNEKGWEDCLSVSRIPASSGGHLTPMPSEPIGHLTVNVVGK